MQDKISTLKFGGICSKGERASDIFQPNERNASPEALICLKCPLAADKCKPNVCKRYKEEVKKTKEKDNG